MSDAYNQMHIKQPKLEAFVLLWFRQSLILYEVLKDRNNLGKINLVDQYSFFFIKKNVSLNQTDSANALHVFICRKFAEIIPHNLIAVLGLYFIILVKTFV